MFVGRAVVRCSLLNAVDRLVDTLFSSPLYRQTSSMKKDKTEKAHWRHRLTMAASFGNGIRFDHAEAWSAETLIQQLEAGQAEPWFDIAGAARFLMVSVASIRKYVAGTKVGKVMNNETGERLFVRLVPDMQVSGSKVMLFKRSTLRKYAELRDVPIRGRKDYIPS